MTTLSKYLALNVQIFAYRRSMDKISYTFLSKLDYRILPSCILQIRSISMIAICLLNAHPTPTQYQKDIRTISCNEDCVPSAANPYLCQFRRTDHPPSSDRSAGRVIEQMCLSALYNPWMLLQSIKPTTTPSAKLFDCSGKELPAKTKGFNRPLR